MALSGEFEGDGFFGATQIPVFDLSNAIEGDGLWDAETLTLRGSKVRIVKLVGDHDAVKTATVDSLNRGSFFLPRTKRFEDNAKAVSAIDLSVALVSDVRKTEVAAAQTVLEQIGGKQEARFSTYLSAIGKYVKETTGLWAVVYPDGPATTVNWNVLTHKVAPVVGIVANVQSRGVQYGGPVADIETVVQGSDGNFARVPNRLGVQLYELYEQQ